MNKTIALMSAATLGFAAPAFAQSANVDTDRAYAQEMISDADGRTSLLQGGTTAGHDEDGFYISSGDGNYNLYVGGLLQFRYYLNFRDSSLGGDEDFTNGFQAARTRLTFAGNVINPDLTFKVQGAYDWYGGNGEYGAGLGNSGQTSPTFGGGATGGNFRLQDAWVKYTFPDSGFFLQFGQMKTPFLHEELVDAQNQLFIERSLANEFFTGDYTQGLAVGYTEDVFRIIGAVSDGARASNSDYNSSIEADIALTARAELKFAGADWERFNDFTSWQGSDFAGYVGAAVHWQQNGETGQGFAPPPVAPGVDPSPNFKALLYTIDLGLEGNGWNIYAAFIGSNLDLDFSPIGNLNNYAVIVQGGVFLMEQFEIAARYDGIFVDSDLGLTDDTLSFITAGVNYYFVPESQAAKLSADVVVSLNTTSGLVGVGGLPVLPQTRHGVLGNTDSGEVSLRLQFQLVF